MGSVQLSVDVAESTQNHWSSSIQWLNLSRVSVSFINSSFDLFEIPPWNFINLSDNEPLHSLSARWGCQWSFVMVKHLVSDVPWEWKLTVLLRIRKIDKVNLISNIITQVIVDSEKQSNHRVLACISFLSMDNVKLQVKWPSINGMLRRRMPMKLGWIEFPHDPWVQEGHRRSSLISNGQINTLRIDWSWCEVDSVEHNFIFRAKNRISNGNVDWGLSISRTTSSSPSLLAWVWKANSIDQTFIYLRVKSKSFFAYDALNFIIIAFKAILRACKSCNYKQKQNAYKSE